MSIKETYEIIQHNIRVSKLAEKVAYSMGLDDETCQSVAVSGLFLDMGKLSMDKEVFSNSRDLTNDEYEYVKQHTTKSTQMLIQASHVSNEVLSSIMHHHENYDGSGYPDGLKGELIPLGARILKICDVFYALLEKRPFREDYSKKEAILIMSKETEKFDPKIMSVFKEVVSSTRINF